MFRVPKMLFPFLKMPVSFVGNVVSVSGNAVSVSGNAVPRKETNQRNTQRNKGKRATQQNREEGKSAYV